jgi:hypothetical protein
MDNICRVNINCGPGSGKSTLAAWLFSELKIAGYDIQLIDEYVKRWAYEKRNINGFDEVYIFSKHMFAEESYLRSGAKIITDCPLLQTAAYCVRDHLSFAPQLIELSNQFEEKYPSINIFLERTNIPYKREGRYEDFTKAKKTDKIILDVLFEHLDNVKLFDTTHKDEILDYIKSAL